MDLIKIDQKLLLGKRPVLEPVPGTFIAGGAIRQWFVGNEPSSDIDVFGTSPDKLSEFINSRLIGAKPLIDRNNLKSFEFRGQLIQVIYFDYYENIHNLLDSFDFNVCQFGWDGTDVYSTQYALTSVLRGHLGAHKITPVLAADSLRRAFKYADKGYKPCLGTLRDLGLSFSGLKKEEIESQVQISPGGGARTVGVD